jgi:hypothetical protein
MDHIQVMENHAIAQTKLKDLPIRTFAVKIF